MLKVKLMSVLVLLAMFNVVNACPCDDEDKDSVTIPQSPQPATSASN